MKEGLGEAIWKFYIKINTIKVDDVLHPDTQLHWIRNVSSLGDNISLLWRSVTVDEGKKLVLSQTEIGV